MPSVTYNAQSFAIDGRRIWILGASIEYARVLPEAWAQRIAAAKQAGFNTIETSCPWLIHEPRKGRFSFSGAGDIRRFVKLCGAAGLWVILRPGPFVGNRYDAGGLPSWLIEMPEVVLREANEPFLERVSLYFRKLFGELGDLLVTNGGPILLVQSEHAWLCSNQKQADRYLQEITRYIRENGVNVPIINSNDLWQESMGTIDTWRGSSEMLVHLRQLRVVQPDAPRLVSAFDSAGFDVWGDAPGKAPDPQVVLAELAQVLAAGGQPVVSPFCGGTNFGFLGGRVAARADGFVTTAASAGAPLSETGARGPTYNAIKRLVSFCHHFSHVFAELDHDYHPITLDVADPQGTPASARVAARGVSVVPLRGSAGRVVFVFGSVSGQRVTLLLEQGIRMLVDLGDQRVGWYLLDVDLRGSGRLDYANLCPFAIVGRSILVLQGPARAAAYLSINGSPLQTVVPAGPKPLVVKHKRVTIVICNQQQIDEAYHDGESIFVGAGGLDEAGAPFPAARSSTIWRITGDGRVERRPAASVKRSSATSTTARSPQSWLAAPTAAYTSGGSPRFATLDGPRTLNDCGAAQGYGWYRIELRNASTGKRLWHLPFAADRAHLFIDGRFQRVIGMGKGADHRPFELSLAKGKRTIVVLLDNLGRFAEGNDLGEKKGLFGHIYQVKRLTGVRAQPAEAEPVDPFSLGGYIAGRTFGQLSDTRQATWTFLHTRGSPILLEVDGAAASGTFVLNDRPFAYYAGETGGCLGRFLLAKTTLQSFRRGKNLLRFAPDSRIAGAAEQVLKATTLYECVSTPTANASWGFSRWEPPPASAYESVSHTAARAFRGIPCWWRGSFGTAQAVGDVRVETSGLSKGQVYVNGHNLGRYFTATADGRAVGPQRHLYVPVSWVNAGRDNEIVVFDGHGFSPYRIRIRDEK